MIEIHSRNLYEEILKITFELRLVGSYNLEIEAMINIKYKIVEKKVKLMAIQLSLHYEDLIKKVEENFGLHEIRKIGYNFIGETLAMLKIKRGEFLKKLEKKIF